jgi:hypothetical protein
MNPSVESRLLGVLRLGDTIRFVLRSNTSGKIAFEIEGAPGEEKPDLLFERIGLLLKGLEDEGYLFSRAPLQKTCEERRDRVAGLWSWVEIIPRKVALTPGKPAEMGFKEDGHLDSQEVWLPELPVALNASFVNRIADLISTARQIKALEIDFTRCGLAEETITALTKALEMRLIADRAASAGFRESPSLASAFLAFWLSQRNGWRIQVRALVRQPAKSTAALLELLGREVFTCECNVAETSPVGLPGSGVIDLVARFPEGWILPAILPDPGDGDRVAAEKLHNKRVPDLPTKGTIIGVAQKRKIRMPIESRDRHTYIAGATGTGKSTLLRLLIRDDIARGESVIVIDPHGDLYQAVSNDIPRSRKRDVFRLDPAMTANLPGFNILDIPATQFRRRHAAFLVGELFRFFEETWDMEICGGPLFEMYFRNTLLLLCLQGLTPELVGLPYNIRAFNKAMCDDEFRKRLLANCPEKSVVQFWTEIAEKTSGDHRLANMVPYIASKINSFVQSGFVSDLVCAQRNDFRIAERMQQGGIILINLNKGLLGAYESRLLGTLLMIEIFAAGLQRSTLPERDRNPVNVYVDEFQNFVSDNVASMFSEARKFGLRLTVANQTLTQLRANRGKQDLLETVLGNVGNMILFRLGVPDAERLRLFLSPFTQQEMQELPNFHALVRLLTPEGPVRPVIMQTVRP